jgi:tetratricopeptide (TPR) repeat protein
MTKCLLILIVSIILIVSCAGPEKSAQNSFEKGVKTLTSGNPEKALEIFDAAAKKYPDQPYGIFGRAVFYNREGLIYSAMDDCQKAIAKDTTFLPGLLLYSQLCLKIDRPELAFFYVTYYLNGGGDLETGISVEAASLLMAGKIDDALNSIERGLEQIPDDPLLRAIKAKCYFHQANFTEGLNECAFAASHAGGNGLVYETIGDAFKLIGLYDSSAVYYDKALESNKNDYYYKADIAEKFINLEYFPRARMLLNEFKAKIDQSYRYYSLSTAIYIHEGRMQRAGEEYGMIIQKYHDSPFVISRLAELRAKLDDRMGSQQYFETSRLFAKRAKFPQAVMYDLRFHYLEMLIGALRIDLAGPVMEELVDSLPNNFRVLESATFLYWARQVPPELKKSVDRIQEAAAGNPADLGRMARLFIRIDSLDLVQAAITGALKVDKINQDAILAQVELLLKLNRPEDAMSFLNSLDEYISYNPEIASQKIGLYKQLGDETAALEFAEQLIEVGKGSIGRYELAVDMARKLGMEDRVRKMCQECIDNNPHAADALYLYAQYTFDQRDFSQTDEYIKKALKLDSVHINSLNLLGNLLVAEGKSDSAVVVYEKVIGLDQYMSDAYSSLALLLADQKTKFTFAINYANKAVMYQPDNSRNYYALARVYYANEKYTASDAYLKKALRIDPDNPDYNYYEGKSLIQVDKKHEAKKYLQKAIKNGLTGELKEDAEKALKRL